MSRPAYGTFGTKGPYPRFSWGEVRCTDGWLPGLPGLRINLRQVCGHAGKYLRRAVARYYGVTTSNVWIIVNSAARSDSYNASLPGAASLSYHTRRRKFWKKRWGYYIGSGVKRRWRAYVYKGCTALDVQVYVRKNGRVFKVHPQRVANLAHTYVKKFRNGGIGVYSTFTHLDIRGYRARWWG